MKIALGLLVAAQLMGMSVGGAGLVTGWDEEVILTEAFEEDGEPTRTEEFEWYYRMYNGVQQKRLWSVTYGRWVTDWINC